MKVQVSKLGAWGLVAGMGLVGCGTQTDGQAETDGGTPGASTDDDGGPAASTDAGTPTAGSSASTGPQTSGAEDSNADGGTTGDSGDSSDGGSGDDGGSASEVFDDALEGAELVYDIRPDLWPTGPITLSGFLDATPWTTGRAFITETRWWHEDAPNGEAMLRFTDPRIQGDENTNPWFRRFATHNDWNETDLFDAVGIAEDKGETIVAEFGLYYPKHAFTGTDADAATWSPGRHIKWMLGAKGSTGVGETGVNPQPEDGRFEVVFTNYGALIADNGEDAKGDFRGPTHWDWDGEHEPSYDGYAEPDYYLNRGNMGVGIYAHDEQISYNFEEMIYPTYPGTDVRRTYGPDTLYEHRIVVSLNTPGGFDGVLYWEIREDGGPWTIARHLTDIDWRGDSEVKFRDAGILFFAGGFGDGWSFGDNDGYAPGAYDRGFYLAYSRMWTK